MNLLLMFEIEVARPYSWWVKERMKWRLICRGRKKAMINDKVSTLLRTRPTMMKTTRTIYRPMGDMVCMKRGENRWNVKQQGFVGTVGW